jgi:hypothetical protein
MHFCTECGTPLPDSNTICHRCGKKAAAPKSKPTTPTPANQSPTPPKTAHIHGISGCTNYLLKGTRPIKGKKMATLDELHHLHNHYVKILDETKTTISRQYDEVIIRLSHDESRLQQQLDEGIARQTLEVDRSISELNARLQNADGFTVRIRFTFHYWVAVILRSHHIHGPLKGNVRELNRVRDEKNSRIYTKTTAINNECNNISRSYKFLKENQPFLAGADGEEYVIGVLSRLPAEYHIINDVNIHFDRAIRWKKRNEYIKNCQIDHIVIGPTGIFLVETKNWKSSDIELKSDNLKHQVQRASLALWYYLKEFYWQSEWPKIRTVIVSMKGSPSGRKPDKYIDIVTPHRLCKYITARKSALDEDAIHKLVRILARDKRLSL